MKIKLLIISLYLLILCLILILLFTIRPVKKPPTIVQITSSPTVASTPSPIPFTFTKYEIPEIEKKELYKIVMIGDSMTAALGPHGGGMSEYMNKLYKSVPNSQRITIDNYAVSSNILSVNNQLNKKIAVNEYTFEPLLSQDYDLVLVESFGYNPLSEFGIEQGIKRQNEALLDLMKTLVTNRPAAAIVFVATIAPNLENYGKSTQEDSSEEGRKKLAEERIMYIKNHIEFAKEHNIPLVNIFEKSLTLSGEGNLKYINVNDDIHPSFLGIKFIGEEIGNFIFEQQILKP